MLPSVSQKRAATQGGPPKSRGFLGKGRTTEWMRPVACGRAKDTKSVRTLCVQRVSGALPLTSRGEFSQWRKLPKKQSGCLFALLAAFVPNSVQDRLYRVFCYTEIEGKDRITRGFRPQKLGITAFFVLSFPPYSLKIFFKIPIRLLHFKRIYAILKRIFGMHYKKH